MTYAWTLSTNLGTVSPLSKPATTCTAGVASGTVTLNVSVNLGTVTKTATAQITAGSAATVSIDP